MQTAEIQIACIRPDPKGYSGVEWFMASLLSGTNDPAASVPCASKRIKFFNACLTKAWESGMAQVPQLVPEAILAKARRKSGGIPGAPSATLSDEWLGRLTLLTDDLQNFADLTPLGRTIAHGQLVSASATMLGMHGLWEWHREIDEQPIERPIIIVGQMRSGTTRLQRLLACDPRFRFTRFHESWNPLPLADLTRHFSGRFPDDRKWRARLSLLTARLLNPDFQAMHPTSALAPDEEIGFFNALMTPAAYEAQWHIPRFVRHCEAMDSTVIYGEFKRMLKTIAWLRGGSDNRPWILKVPQFAEDLDAVLQAFPDARIIHTIRDDDAVVASSSSLVSNQMMLQSDAVDPRQIGREWSRKVALRTERTASALAATKVPRIEVRFEDVDRNWGAEMERIYAALELPLTKTVEQKMLRYLRSSAGHSASGHSYDPADFGLPARNSEIENPAGRGSRYQGCPAAT